MFRYCIENKVKKIINFGCCYSKISHSDYNISKLSDKSIELNLRTLSCATLGFEPTPLEFYEFRHKIMDYKFSFYHLLYKKFGHLEFCAMGNARRSLYSKSFPEYVQINLEKFFPDLDAPTSSEIEEFHQSDSNIELNEYLKVYYAFSRFFGRLVEAYVLCDRALFLKEAGLEVKIMEVFDPDISPRNKAIIAIL